LHRLFAERPKLKSLIAALALALLLSACATNGATTAQELAKTKADIASEDFSQVYRDQYAQFLKTYSLTKGTVTATTSMVNGSITTTYTFAATGQISTSDNAALKEFAANGFNYVDRKCSEYFQLLHTFYRHKREHVTGINLVTGLLSGVAAAAKAKASEIAVLAVSGTSAAALVDNEGSSLLFELDPSSTQGLVNRALISYRADAAKQSVQSFSDAMTAIQGYAGICTPVQIDRLIKEAVQSNNPKPAGAAAPAVVAPSASIMGVALETNQALNDDQVAALYWLLNINGAKDDAKQVAAIRTALGEDTAKLLLQEGVDKLRATAADVQRQARAAAALAFLATIDATLKTRAQAMQAKAAAQPAPAPAPAPVVKQGVSPNFVPAQIRAIQ